jgi:hypothetical protein
MKETLSSPNISTRLERIASLAREAPDLAFTTLAHHVDIDLLKEAYRRTRKDGAVGVDGRSAAAYAMNLEENLRSLLDRAKSGTYRAPNVRRVHIPKGDGSATRPLGIPTFEDKVLQRAVMMVLEPIYEQDFLVCSYGFRPRRSAHDARRVLAVLPKRLGKYGLTLHPEKTRLVEFRRPDRRPPAAGPGPGTFDFLGFTQLWLKSHKGRWILRQQTAKDRLRRAMRAVSTWCRRWRHLPMKQQHRALVRKLYGHYAYFGVIGNWRAMKSYWHRVKAIWFKWLNRRSNRGFPWDEIHIRLKRFVLPLPRITSRAANP